MVYLGLYDANTGFSPDPKDTERFKEFLSQKYERKRFESFAFCFHRSYNKENNFIDGMLNQQKQ